MGKGTRVLTFTAIVVGLGLALALAGFWTSGGTSTGLYIASAACFLAAVVVALVYVTRHTMNEAIDAGTQEQP